MSAKSDWIEQNHEKLNDQANATVFFLTTGTNLQRMGISGNALDWFNNEVMIKLHTFNVAYDAWKNPAERTPAKTAALLTAEKEFIHYLAIYSFPTLQQEIQTQKN